MAQPAKKSNEIRDFQSEIMRTDVPRSIKADICVSCKGPATEFNNEISKKEFTLSGLCQKCQDEVFSSLEDDE